VKCILCADPGIIETTVTMTLQREYSTIAVQDVPAFQCTRCGEFYLDEKVAGRVIRMGEKAARNSREFEMILYID